MFHPASNCSIWTTAVPSHTLLFYLTYLLQSVHWILFHPPHYVFTRLILSHPMHLLLSSHLKYFTASFPTIFCLVSRRLGVKARKMCTLSPPPPPPLPSSPPLSHPPSPFPHPVFRLTNICVYASFLRVPSVWPATMFRLSSPVCLFCCVSVACLFVPRPECP
jgi:hypothetical protein